MLPKMFDCLVMDGALLRGYEPNIKKITHSSAIPCETNSYIDYITIENAIVPVVKYHIFDRFLNLIHGCSTRQGGVSKSHLASMNLSSSRGDDIMCVKENYRRLGEALSFDPNRLVCSDQVHSTNIYIATEEDAGRGTTEKEKLKEIDGIVTNVKNLPIMTFYADCVPLYFYDPVKEVIAMAHSGWRGTVNNIGGKMILLMQKQYHCNPRDIVCAIGPSICKACYEVSEDVAVAFADAYSPEQYQRMITAKDNEKYQLDLHIACYFNFINAGICSSNIALPDYCTCCNPNVFFSHRATRGKRGNLGAVIMMRQ